MQYHRDKNGVELNHKLSGYCLKDSENNYYELGGSGRKIPGMGDTLVVWTKDDKRKIMRASELEYVPPSRLLEITIPLAILVIYFFIL